MKQIKFKFPERQISRSITLRMKQKLYEDLKIISETRDVLLSQAVETLLEAAISIYFEQFPMNEDEKKRMFEDAMGSVYRYCKYEYCPTKPNTHAIKDMFVVNNLHFCTKKCKQMYLRDLES